MLPDSTSPVRSRPDTFSKPLCATRIEVQLTRPDANLGDQILSIRVDRSIPVPAYAQIAEELRGLLRPGAAPGDAELPSERLLCEAFQVSRMTLRQALDELEREGLIERRRGRGTFVALHAAETGRRLLTIEDAMNARIAAGSMRLLSFRLVKPSAPVREFLELPGGARVYQIRRLRTGNEVPLALESVQVPPALCPNLDQLDLVRDPVHRILEQHYGLKPEECLEEISAAVPNATLRHILQVPASAAILMVRRKTRTSGAVPVEFAITAYRGDLYTAVVRSGLSPAGCETTTRIHPCRIAGRAQERPDSDGS